MVIIDFEEMYKMKDIGKSAVSEEFNRGNWDMISTQNYQQDIDDEPSKHQRDVVLSIKPVYSEKILNGSKTVKLRRRFPVSAPNGTLAYIYSTSPVKAISRTALNLLSGMIFCSVVLRKDTRVSIKSNLNTLKDTGNAMPPCH